MKVDVIGSNSLLFANLPPASQVPGRTYRVSDVGPAPGILLTSNGTRYRPSGGRQVLAMRANNPVTVQNLTGGGAPSGIAETIGPFPGGVVRADMRLEINVAVSHAGISAGMRYALLRVGNSAGSMANFAFGQSDVSGSFLEGRLSGFLDVLSDTSAAHRGGLTGVGSSYSLGSTILMNPTVNFSAAWQADINLVSAAETATTITGATWSAGVATYTTSAAHTLAVGDKDVISGITPSDYNGTFIVSAVGSSTTFSVPMAVNPGTYTSGGQSSRISNMISRSYVLELVG